MQHRTTTATNNNNASAVGVVPSLMNRPKRRKRRPQRQPKYVRRGGGTAADFLGTCIIIPLGAMTVVLLWGLGSLLIYLFSIPFSSQQQSAAGHHPRVLLLPGFRDFPDDATVVDIWPDNRILSTEEKGKQDDPINELFQELFQSCLPHENPECQEGITSSDGDEKRNNNNNQKTTHKIGIIRPPGVLGRVFESFVIQFVDQAKKSKGDGEIMGTNIVLIPTSHIGLTTTTSEQQHYLHSSFTKIIRPAILPILLEATDLALQAAMDDGGPVDDTTSNETTIVDVADIIHVVKQLLRWHCRLSKSHIATLTIPFDRLISYPMDAQKDLTMFLGFPQPENNKNKGPDNKANDGMVVDMEELVETVFHRIDSCTNQLRSIHGNDNNGQTIEEAVQTTVREELGSQSCHLNPLLSSSIPTSRVTELVAHLLSHQEEDPESSPSTVCEKYPNALLCTQ